LSAKKRKENVNFYVVGKTDCRCPNKLSRGAFFEILVKLLLSLFLYAMKKLKAKNTKISFLSTFLRLTLRMMIILVLENFFIEV